MKTFLFQGDSITDANRDDENLDNFGLGCGYAFLLASDIEKANMDKWGDVLPFYKNIKKEGVVLWKAA